jgi:hypothetical protein
MEGQLPKFDAQFQTKMVNCRWLHLHWDQHARHDIRFTGLPETGLLSSLA